MTKEHLYTIDWSEFKAENLRPAFEKHKKATLDSVDELLAQEKLTEEFLYGDKSYDDELDDELHYNPMGHLKAVADNEEFRKAYDELVPEMTDLSTYLLQNEKVYQAYKKLADSPEFQDFDFEHKRDIEKILLNYKLGGIALDEAGKKEYAELTSQLSKLQVQFNNNIIDDRQAWTKLIKEEDVAQLEGLSEQGLALLSMLAQQNGQEGYLLTLDAPVQMQIMQFCKNRELRKEYYYASAFLASKLSTTQGKYDNTDVVEKIVELKTKKAKLVGFKNYAELSLAEKMAESPAEVLEFLRNLRDRALEKGKEQVRLVTEFAKERDGIDKFEPWDQTYYFTLYAKEKYDVDQEEVRKYFPQDKVFTGMFEIFNRLYDIEFKVDESVVTYHPDVKFYRVYEKGQLIAGVYFDLYARNGKRPGAWMADAFNRNQTKTRVKLPVTYITCNFNPPVNNQPAYLSLIEVETLFHEMGHGLHLLLTKVKTSSLCGTSVEWDAVELPSQLHENWCNNEESLKLLTAHKDTGEPMPKSLIDKLNDAKQFTQGAVFILRQLAFGIFDMTLYSRDESDKRSVQQIWDDTREYVLKPLFGEQPASTFPCSFGHIFSGGYAAGYYSYLWAEVLACDAFEAYLEVDDIFSKDVATKFKDNVLATGGVRPSMENYVAFRGRKPELDALLKSYGIN